MAGSPSRQRSRSRSPPRRGPRASNKGFRWKEKRSDEGYDDRRDNGRRHSYRDRSPQYDRYRRDRERDGPRFSRREDNEHRDKGDCVKMNKTEKTDKKEKKEKKEKAATIQPGQEMIVIHINDRLGTKTAIPCLPSDTIGQLKLMIAGRIGRESGQIMLRRQGERPFKDPLSLEDYGISNGVQLDLEVDTGD